MVEILVLNRSVRSKMSAEKALVLTSTSPIVITAAAKDMWKWFHRFRCSSSSTRWPKAQKRSAVGVSVSVVSWVGISLTMFLCFGLISGVSWRKIP
jgi:hypothetical protein